jgi:hypothetical protein
MIDSRSLALLWLVIETVSQIGWQWKGRVYLSSIMFNLIYSGALSTQVRLAQGDQQRNYPARLIGLPDRRKTAASSIEEEAEPYRFGAAC